MPATSTTRRKPGSQDTTEVDRFVAALSHEAGRLARPVLCLGIVSLCSASLLWTLSFSAYMTDSLQSFAVCLSTLLFVLVPGVFLLLLYLMLRQLSSITEDLPPIEIEDEAEPPVAGGPRDMRTLALSWGRRLRSRLDSVTTLWSALEFSKSELLEAGAKKLTISFLAHPVSAFTIGGAILMSALLILSAGLWSLWSMVSSLF